MTQISIRLPGQNLTARVVAFAVEKHMQQLTPQPVPQETRARDYDQPKLAESDKFR